MTENSQNVCDTVITRDDTIEDNIDFVNLKTIIYIIHNTLVMSNRSKYARRII